MPMILDETLAFVGSVGKTLAGVHKAAPVQEFKPPGPAPVAKDLLRYARSLSREEGDKEINRAFDSAWQIRDDANARKISHPNGVVNWGSPINVANGDTIEFTWKGEGKALFHATGSGSFYTHRPNQ